jgi:hypothetical protein
MIIYPAVQFKTIESHALAADPHLKNVRSHPGVEPVPIHAEVTRRIAKPD